MSPSSCVAPPALADFEFAPLELARNYRNALINEFGSVLRGAVLEVGAGVGHITKHLTEIASIDRVVALEPSSDFRPQLCQILPESSVVTGTVASIPEDNWDAIVCVNVLEHIENDLDELKAYRSRLAQRQGHLCLFVPARPELYAPIDKDFGHYRRYVRPGLAARLNAAGFEVLRLNYFNFIGYFIWWLNFKTLKNRRFDSSKVVLFDRFIFPVVHALESKIMRPPFGQSLLAIARAGRSV